jgi:hypothetical protein
MFGVPASSKSKVRVENIFFLFFARIGRSDLTKKLEKVGPFECDELEKRVENIKDFFPWKILLVRISAHEQSLFFMKNAAASLRGFFSTRL